MNLDGYKTVYYKLINVKNNKIIQQKETRIFFSYLEQQHSNYLHNSSNEVATGKTNITFFFLNNPIGIQMFNLQLRFW